MITGLGELWNYTHAGPVEWPVETLPTDDLGLIRMADIIAASCVVFDITEAELKSGSRKRCMARARQVASYVAREHTGFSYPFIARAIGGFDHTSILWGDRRIAAMLETGQEKIRAKVHEVRIMLRRGNAREVYRAHIAALPVRDTPKAKVAAKEAVSRSLAERRKQLREIGFLPGRAA